MTPVNFPQSNINLGPPEDVSESDCARMPAFVGEVLGGVFDGSRFVVVAWKPDARELLALNSGSPVFLSVINGMPPHFVSTSFTDALQMRKQDEPT